MSRQIVDYAPAISTRAMRAKRRYRIFWRCAIVASSILFCVSLYDLVTAVIDYQQRTAQVERVTKAGRVER